MKVDDSKDRNYSLLGFTRRTPSGCKFTLSSVNPLTDQADLEKTLPQTGGSAQATVKAEMKVGSTNRVGDFPFSRPAAYGLAYGILGFVLRKKIQNRPMSTICNMADPPGRPTINPEMKVDMLDAVTIPNTAIKLISLSHFLRNKEGALKERETQFYGAGKKCAIPSWVWALESIPSESILGLTPTLRRVTLTNLIAGPLVASRKNLPA